VIPAIKKSSFELAKHLGLASWLAGSRWRRRRLLMLCYHGVSLADEHEWNPELYISASTFAHRLDSLARMQCTVLPLADAVRQLYAGTLPDRAVALTFDDGFYDFKAAALPALEARGYPATVYVATQRCQHEIPIAHLLTSYLLWKHRPLTLDARGIEGMNCIYPLASPAGRARLTTEMFRRMRREQMNPQDEHVFARELMDRLHVDYEAAASSRLLRVLSGADLREISGRGTAIEMHTHRHRAPEDPDEFIEEVRVNGEAVQAMTGRRPRHLCYPDGLYRSAYLSKLETEGIETATTCDPALASPASHRLLLPRFVDNEMVTQIGFEAWVTGVASWLPRRTLKADAVH
jgi:peptidoglycan/xylan/chitin deacetylase (PgdA/CDA1 family)